MTSTTLSTDELLDIPEVCRRLSMEKSAVYDLMGKGLLVYITPVGFRGRRVKASDLQKYIDRATKGGGA
jgi:excisionase family DNA binding protein